ncbi:MAG: CRISPR-associated protein Csy1 [Flavobacteriales bacterium]|jgi:CRISPR-associated protein Csy1
MLDEAIKEFFDQRKEAWLKKNIKLSLSTEEVAEVELACERAFALAEWLPNAAKRAGQISIATHPCTFSHPSARKNKNGYVTSVIADTTVNVNVDGYLRSGNVNVEPDALGNAAALDVYKFLHIILHDGLTVLQHIQSDSETANKLLSIPTESYEELKRGFLAMINTEGGEVVTSSKIKQVYFPADDDYHLLSIVTNSGIVFDFRNRLDELRFSDEVKAKRELRKNKKFSEHGYSEIYGLTTIGYGGTKPQNISVLNNKNGGKAYLLAASPPALQQRDVRFPTHDLFKKGINVYHFKEAFEYLHKVMTIPAGGVISREKLLTARDNSIKSIVLQVMDAVYLWRSVAAEQFRAESSALPAEQKTWLLPSKASEREQEDAWLGDIIHSLVKWINTAYDKTLADKKILLGHEEFTAIKELIASWVADNKEFLR